MQYRGLVPHFLLALFFLWCGDSSRFVQAAERPSLASNVQRLLKTRSCPGCDLAGADLRQAQLHQANLEKANLSGARLSHADLSQANLKAANLKNADLSGTDLRYANLDGAKLGGAVLQGALFAQTKMRGQVVNRLLHADQQQPSIVEPKAETGMTSQTQQTSNPPPQPSSVEAQPGKSDGGQTDNNGIRPTPENTPPSPAVKPVDAKEAIIARMFERKRCVGCDLSSVNLADEDLAGFDLERADFSSADLQGTDFSEANLKGARFLNARLQQADFEEADLYRADFSGADLTEANFEEATIDGSDFSGAVGVNLEGAIQGKRSR